MSSTSKRPQIQTSFYSSLVQIPVGPSNSVAGSGAGADLQARKRAQLAMLMQAGKVLKNHLMMRRLTDRIHDLMRDDLRNHHERSRDYGGHF